MDDEFLKYNVRDPISGVPICLTPGCDDFVESSEEYCSGCLDDQMDKKRASSLNGEAP